MKNALTLIAALAIAAVCVRLGFWQLDRHRERTAAIESRLARSALPEVTWHTQVPSDTAGLTGRRVRVTGRWGDPSSDVILRSRSMDGRPGVELLSAFLVGDPGAVEGAGDAVMVVRGWLPAADGLSPQLARAGTRRTANELSGTLISSREGRGGAPVWAETDAGPRLALGGVDLDVIADSLGLDPSPHVILADWDGSGGFGPPRELPTDGGPHLSYAVQWFSFAVIGLVGTAILLRRRR
ncbi:MAG: SURF1 family protein [Gemmatimonadetes bacterium]|nr:SURF1 family protein [Gemmatimonadota bacterium]